jgi:hypothetical protein
MPAKTERYRFKPWEILDVNGTERMLLNGYADVTHGLPSIRFPTALATHNMLWLCRKNAHICGARHMT